MIKGRRDFTAMGCPCALHAYAPDNEALNAAFDAAQQEVLRIEAKYSRYRDDSVVAAINAAAGQGSAVTVDEETVALLNYAQTVFEESEGVFDITSGVLRKIWRLREGIIPDAGEVEALLPDIGWSQVSWQAPAIHLPRVGMEIDFGGFGKEYAADRSADVLRLHGIRHGLVDLGGDVHVVGPHPDNSAWQIGVRHPQHRDRPIARVALRQGAMATSGDYERVLVKDGQRYSHLLDPRSGMPIKDNPASVSVLAERCLLAGTASTVAMLRGPLAEPWLQAMGLPWMLVTQQGQLRGSAMDATSTAGLEN